MFIKEEEESFQSLQVFDFWIMLAFPHLHFSMQISVSFRKCIT